MSRIYLFDTNKAHVNWPNKFDLSYDVASESVIKPCNKNDNPLVE